jgi:hypothetical protein
MSPNLIFDLFLSFLTVLCLYSTIFLSKSPKWSTTKQTIYATTENAAATLTSLAIETEVEWPFRHPHFELRGLNNELSKALMISYSPLVTLENRSDWEDHAFAKQGWIQEGSTSPDLHEGFISDDFKPPTFRKTSSVSRTVRPVCHTGWPWCRLWTWTLRTCMGTGAGPHDPSIINFDLLSHPVFNRVYHGMWETRLPVMSEVTDLDFFYGGAI